MLWLSPTQTLTYSTFFGGSENDKGKAIAVDSERQIWIAGDTQSTDLPNSGGFQGSLIGAQNMFVAGFDPVKIRHRHEDLFHLHRRHALGRGLWHSAGAGWNDLAGGRHLFARHLDPGKCLSGLYGGDGDAYIAHINPGLGAKALLYASFLGGSGIDEATSMVLDPSGRIILSGYTLSSNFPVTSDAFQTGYGGNTDAFIAVLDTAKGTVGLFDLFRRSRSRTQRWI